MSSLLKKVKLRQYKDKRGDLVENTFAEIMQKSKHFFISKSKPQVIRANHYHLRKSEWFYVIQGTCRIILKDLKSNESVEFTVNDTDHQAINIKPNIAHAFHNIGKNELILLALINEIHNQDDPDTYEYKLL